jgi:hypothetical protein
MKIFLVILAMFSSNVYAQKIIPNNVDLRSAYCISRTNEVVSLLTSIVSNFSTEPLAAREMVNKHLVEEQNKLKRMQGYLIPRLKYLDNEILLIASNQYRVDNENMSKCETRNKCSPKNTNFVSCAEACKVESGVGEKMGQCEDIAWLPY